MGHGVRPVVGKGEMCLCNAMDLKDLFGLSVDRKEWFSQGIVLHLDIRPSNPVSQPPADRFQKGLLCRKTQGEAVRGPAPLSTSLDFSLGEHAVEKKISPSGDDPVNAINIDDINTRPYDHNDQKGSRV